MLRELIRRSFWLAIGAAVGRLLPLAVLLLASRQMETRQFASASAAYAWAGVAMSLTSVGPATVMTQRLGMATQRSEQIGLFAHHARQSIVWSSLLALAVIVFREQGGVRIFGAALDLTVVVPAALSGALWSQVAVCVAALNGSHRARAASAALASSGLLQGGGMALAIRAFGAHAQPAAWGLLAGSALALGVAVVLIQRALSIPGLGSVWLAVKHTEAPVPLWRHPVLWNTVAAASAMPVSFFASAMIAHGSDGTRQLAQYFALEQVHQLLVYLPTIVGQAMLPLMSRQLGHLGSGAHRSPMLRRIALLALGAAFAGLLVATAIIADVGWFVRLLRNPALTANDVWPIRWMVLNAALGLSLSVTGGAFLGAGRIVSAGLLNLSWGIIFVGLTAVLASHGNVGLQAARFAASMTLEAAATLILLVWATRDLNQYRSARRAWKESD